MVVINPGYIIGPLLLPTLNLSVEIIVDMVKGKNPLNCRYYRFVDVRDVAPLMSKHSWYMQPIVDCDDR